MKFHGLDLSRLTDDQVLFFIRIRGKKSYFNNVYTNTFLSIFKSLKSYRTISEYPKDADIHIDLAGVSRDWLTEIEFESFNKILSLDDLILRCRGLRNTNYMDARKLVFRAYLYFDALYRKNTSLKLIICGAIDNYVMDIMYQLGCRYEVKFLGVTDSFMSPEYKLLSVRGECFRGCIPTDEQVYKMYERIRNTALSPSLPSRRKAIMRACYGIGSYVYRVTVRHLVYYKLQGKLAYEYVFAPYLKGFSSLDQLFALRYLKTLTQVKRESGKMVAYLPLHYFPEATTDYWIDDQYHADYITSLFNTIKYLHGEGFQILVKEHPAFYLSRSSDFYRMLDQQGCQILSPFIPTVDVFAITDLVVVWNGSTGIEAIVHRIPVVKVTNSYYGDGIIPELFAAASLPVPTDEMGLQVVQKVLESSFSTL